MSTGLTESADLILEDGTGVVDANTYNDLATITAYATERQYAPLLAWIDADESNRVSAAITAASYMDDRWRFLGMILVDGDGDPDLQQGLHFPVMADVFDSRGVEISETVPRQISEAHAEYACRSISPTTFEAEALQKDLTTQDSAGREITRLRSKVGSLEEETYYDVTGVDKWVDYGRADQIVRRSGLAGSFGNRVIRS
jgi:hypothetical protein